MTKKTPAQTSGHPATVDDARSMTNVPVVIIDQESIFTYINDCFTKNYGWTEAELLGKSVNKIVPVHMRDAHAIGFSRFLATEQSVLLGKPLSLPILFKDGTTKSALHYIIGDKREGRWHFAAVITVDK